ncbi:MAG: hypothetical protein HYS33_07095 [Acidobacteria bacterium]|nr:hypothetical protein [Acidobacteriota bacterium]
MKRMAIGTLMFILVLPIATLAQGSGSSAPPSSPRSVGEWDKTSFAVTRTVKGKIVKVTDDKQFIVVEDKNGKRVAVRVGEKTKFKADKKTELAGRDDITLGDFELGQPVKVTYLASGSMATELKLLRARN